MNLARSRLRKVLAAAKVLLALVIVLYLMMRIQNDAGFTRLYQEPKQWSYLAGALLMVLTAFLCSFLRWNLLVRGLGLTFHWRDALRLGTLGFMLNQVMPGSVGGDLFKAAFIAHEQPGRRTEAVASVFIDRFVGLVAILAVASVALMFVRPELFEARWLESVKIFVWSATGIGIAALLLLTSRLVSGLRTQSLAERVPVIGHALSRLVAGLNRFSSRRGYLTGAFALALTTHCLLISSFWCISKGLPITGPTFRQNALVVPLALVAGAIPLTPGGLGITETALAKLYAKLSLVESDGALVALAYRALTYIVASIGACYYLSAKRRMDRLLEEAEELAEEIE